MSNITIKNKGIKIALCGKMRSGKDTVARFFLAEGYKRYAFGDKVKEVASVIYPEEMAAGKPREILQGVGQGLRTFDPDIWVKAVINAINQGKEKDNIIITDLRQPNEYAILKAAGFTIVRVTAPEDVRIQRAEMAGDNFRPEDLNHDTESHIDDFIVDYEIVNDGTIRDLYFETLKIITI